jgi:integrase
VNRRKSFPCKAEGEGFEPSNGFPLLVFKTSAIGHSATPPKPLPLVLAWTFRRTLKLAGTCYRFPLPFSAKPTHAATAQAPQEEDRQEHLLVHGIRGKNAYFGNVETVSFAEARSLFTSHLQSLAGGEEDSKRKGLTAGELMDLFLDWVEKNRSRDTYTTRRTYCSRFGSFPVGTRKTRIADLPANKVTGDDLVAWLAHLEAEEGLGAQTRRHAETSVKHCWNWATKRPSPVPYLPPTYRPFSSVERVYVPPKVLTENDLLTEAEAETLFAAAAIDLDQFHRLGPRRTPRAENPYGSFADLLKCYYHTGARTGELAACEVGDVLFRTGQIILGRHKRSRTQRMPTIRHITLNGEALAIFRKHCEGKQPTDKVFANSDRRPWTGSLLPKRFERMKEVGRVLMIGEVRDEITIYDFRHLWISEMLMAGNDVATVARMAGTSIAMVERVYGHFGNEHLQGAQDRLDQARKQRRGQSPRSRCLYFLSPFSRRRCGSLGIGGAGCSAVPPLLARAWGVTIRRMLEEAEEGHVAYFLPTTDPRSREHHPRYAAALVAMAAGQGVTDIEAAAWVLRDGADLAGQLAGG